MTVSNEPFPPLPPLRPNKIEIRCMRCGYLPKIVYQTPFFVVVTDHGKVRCFIIRAAKKLGW